jgi:spore coat polysaccharide biosynthesis protein SpsF
MSDIKVRRATAADIQAVFVLSNQRSIREKSFRNTSIGWPEHVEWFDRILKDPNCSFYVAEVDGRIAAQVRFSRDGELALVSISVSQDCRRKGVGRQMFQMALKDFKSGHPYDRIVAKIKPENLQSMSFFQGLGFRTEQSERSGQVVVMSLPARCGEGA